MNRYTDSIEARLSGRHKKCMQFCGGLKDKKILNIGCYNGWFEKFASENGCREIIGIDINEETLLRAKNEVKYKAVKFIKASGLNLSQFRTDYFDVVTMFDTMEHFPKDKEEKAISEIHRVLKRDGSLIISVPNDTFFSKFFDPAWYFGHRHYSRNNMEQLLSKMGFKVEEVDYGGGFWELFSIILLYIFKWIFKREIPFKKWFDKKRDKEYLEIKRSAFLFVKAIK